MPEDKRMTRTQTGPPQQCQGRTRLVKKGLMSAGFSGPCPKSKECFVFLGVGKKRSNTGK